ncbi:hypothetical protein [Moritella dasanensis]|uniref:hypothetical protein n=1 Tax=Moritella dasanensis TaxID=428031 RepID=UPI0002E3AE22|nr:hypothetical protein [Moritella dasanensis]
MKAFILFVALFSNYSIAGNIGFNEGVELCASLLPKAKVYNVSVEYNIDTTQAKMIVNGSFGVEWSPEYNPSADEEKAAFKSLEPFVLCMSKELTGKD